MIDDPVTDSLQRGVDECLDRLPQENRFGVGSLRLLPGSRVGEPPLAIDVELRQGDGRLRHIPIRSRAWVNGYLDGKGRADTCRSLTFPPDILPIAVPTVVVEIVAAHSIVRGVMCLLRHEEACSPAGDQSFSH